MEKERIELSAYQEHRYNNLRLNFEIVPTYAINSSLRKRLSQSEWKKVQRVVFANAGYLCEICESYGSTRRVDCHEVWDYDDETQIQKLVKFMALCPKCHGVKHPGFVRAVFGEKAHEEALGRFMVINELKIADAELFYAYARQVDYDRQNIRWKMDLSILHNYDVDVRKSDIDIYSLINYSGPRYYRKSKKKSPHLESIEYQLDKNDFKCPYCYSKHFIKSGKLSSTKYRYLCKNVKCKKSFSSTIDIRPSVVTKAITLEELD